ncbi:MAG: hypothetical protein CSA05_02275 [Bacteroidia bacterium]|nr:MAG: hypothetical protein CSA05_02275 [Bacteroidia bacterium]
MKNFFYHLITVLLLFAGIGTQAHNYMYVQDPQTWQSGQGTIEEATITMKPVGIYMQYDLTLTFSARDEGFADDQQLEVNLMFDLPQGAILYDSWLWIEDYISKAVILDRWKAADIYNEIVGRRKDPSILIKNGDNSYNLSIYPMLGNETRKAKISYLLPMKWTKNLVTGDLPLEIMKLSRNSTKIKLQAWQDSEWRNTRILEREIYKFEKAHDIEGKYFELQLPENIIDKHLHIAYDSPAENGMYFSYYETEDEGYYQLALIPNELLQIENAKKVVFVVDYRAQGREDAEKMLDRLEKTLLSNFKPTDYFNIVVPKVPAKPQSDNWIQATEENIRREIKKIKEEKFYNNLFPLLREGIKFINKNGEEGSVFLITNSNDLGDYQKANQIITNITGLMKENIPIYTANIQKNDYHYYWIGNRYYFGNEYLYSNLARITGGQYLSLKNGGDAYALMNELMQYVGENIHSFDLYTTLHNGFCFGRHNVNRSSNTVSMSQAILQVGKYKGSLPFNFQLSGILHSKPFSTSIQIPLNQTKEGDSLTTKIWAGNYIQSLEKLNYENNTIFEIIDFSMNNRILSLYTAFLALEREMEGAVNENINMRAKGNGDSNEQQGGFTEIEELQKNNAAKLQMLAYPNPFTEETTIKIELTDNFSQEKLVLQVYDLSGRMVHDFNPKAHLHEKTIEIQWNGKDNSGNKLRKGIYFVVLSNSHQRHTMKLIIQ